MRALGLVGLLVALLIVGWLVKGSLTTTVRTTTSEAPAAAAPPQQAVQAYGQDLKRALDEAAAARASEAAR